MATGITLARHYAAGLLRLQGGAAIGANLLAARGALEWWKERPGPRQHLLRFTRRAPGKSAPCAGRGRWLPSSRNTAICERLVDRYIAAEAVLDAELCRTLARRGLADVPDEGAIF